MAVVVAQATGNFSAGATWVGGVKPAPGDIAETANFVVTIDEDFTGTLRPTGSGYFIVATGGITITGDLVMQSTYTGGGLRCIHGSGTVALTGTATGGAGNYASGAYNNSTGALTVGTATGGAGSYASGAYNNSIGTLTVGTATGGAGSSASGALNNSAGTLNVGTATGGAGNYAYGAYNNSTGTLTVGTATGGAGSGASGAYNNSTGTLICDLAIGSNWGPGGTGNLNSGVYGTGAVGQTTKVKRVQSGAYGAPGIWGFVLIEPDATNSAQFRLTPGGSTLTLVDAAAAADFPAATDVRSGVVFDGGDKVGTCAVPVAANVSYGVPVDATVGTAVLSAAAVEAAVWDAARSGHAGAGTFGATSEWAGSVDEAAIATAAAAAILAAADSDPISANVTYSAGVAVSGRLAEVTDLPSEPLDATATQAAAAAALTAYDPPTNAEFEARTLPAADYTVVSDLPSAASIADAVWDEAIAGHAGAGSTGAALAAATAPSAASIADAVWDEAIAGHAVAGSTGAALAAAGSAGDPWSTPLPGAYGAGTAGKLLADLPTATEVVAAMDADPPAVNVTHHAGVAVAAADANGNVPVVLYPTQGAVTFGQVKILADVANEGALHVVNSSSDGIGQRNQGGYTGQGNYGGNRGQYNEGSDMGQYNNGVDIGQCNQGNNIGQNNVGNNHHGQYNYGFDSGQTNEDDTNPVFTVDANSIRAAVGLAAANLDTKLAPLDVAVSTRLAPAVAGRTAAVDASGGVALAASQGAVTFGQVKILANVSGEGALHVVNSHANGHGQRNQGGNAGQYNYGSNGQYNYGSYNGQYNYGLTEAGQLNQGSLPIIGAAQQEIADALKRAPAAGAPAAGSVYDLLGDVALEATAQAILEDTGTTLPAAIAGISAAGDPWATALPGAYGAGTAGALLSGIDSSVDEAAIAAAVLAAADSDPISANVTTWAGVAVAAEGARVVEGAHTVDDILRIIAAALAGETSGSGTSTVEILGLDGATTRITATLDGNGNRTSMTLDGT